MKERKRSQVWFVEGSFLGESFTCGERIVYLQSPQGGLLTEQASPPASRVSGRENPHRGFSASTLAGSSLMVSEREMVQRQTLPVDSTMKVLFCSGGWSPKVPISTRVAGQLGCTVRLIVKLGSNQCCHLNGCPTSIVQ